MAATGEHSVSLAFSKALASHPGHYSFYATVRRIEQLSPDCPRVGSWESSLKPAVRFAQVPHLYFPPSELFDYTLAAGGGCGTLQVYFFGLFGPGGALPLTLTEYVYERSRHHYDLTMQRFADIFHDRLISLFYRAGTRSQAAVSYDRPEEDELGDAAAALAGVPADPAASAPLPAFAPVAFGRELVNRNQAAALRRALEGFFGVPVTIQQHSPCRIPIDEEARCRLGLPGVCELGRNSLLGERQRSITEQVTLIIGPLRYERYERFLPGSIGYQRLQAWLKLMSTRPLIWELQFRIMTESIPAPSLNASCRLGGNSIFPDPQSETTTCTLTLNF